MTIKLVFFGNEKFATGIANVEPIIQDNLREDGYEIEAVVTGEGIPRHEAKLAVLAAYGKILPQSVLDEFPLGIINVHPSMLPIYRGSTPIEQAILDGAAFTGVSIMKLTDKMDAGPIFIQEAVGLSGNETKADLARSLQEFSVKLLLKILPGIINGSLKPQDQDSSVQPIYTKLIKKTDGIIDWNKPAQQLEREVRAYLGWPGSYSRLGDKDVIITEAHIESAKPDKQLAVECGDGQFLVIDRLKPAGKREMSAAEYLAGHKKD